MNNKQLQIDAYTALSENLISKMKDAIAFANASDILRSDRVTKARQLHITLGKYLEDYDAAQEKLTELR